MSHADYPEVGRVAPRTWQSKLWFATARAERPASMADVANPNGIESFSPGLASLKGLNRGYMRHLLPVWLLLPLLTSGCVTHHLWTESTLDEWNEPASSPNLRLYHDAKRHDFLVVYDEYSERRECTQSRAFFLQQNQGRLAEKFHPHFVNINSSRGLAPVPVFFSAPPFSPEPFYALTATNSPDFEIFSSEWEIGSYQLPGYNDGTGPAKRIALTPFAVTADLALIGGGLGIYACYAYANGYSSEH